MRRPTLAGACLISAALSISGQPAFGQSQQRGGSSSSSSSSYGSSSSSSSSYGSASTTRSSSSNSYGTSNSSYGTSSNSYGTSSNSYGSSRNTYGSSGSQTRPSEYRPKPTRLKDRSPNRLYVPVLVRGKVVIEGAEGESPPEPVVVRMSCGGQSLPQDYTDRSGRFWFQPSCRPVLAISDASARAAFFGWLGAPGIGLRTGPSLLDLSRCWLYAELPGYISSHLWLGMTNSMGTRKVGKISLRRIEGSTGRAISITTLTAPKKAKKAYKKGSKALLSVEEPDYDEAILHLERAVDLHPDFAAAWEALGRARQGVGDDAGARVAFNRSVEADSQFLKPYLSLMEMALADDDWAELESLADRYLAMSPGSMKARYYSALSSIKLGNMSQAESMASWIDNAGEMGNWPVTYFILAAVHASRAEFEEAAALYKRYIASFPTGTTSDQVRRILHDWSALQVIDPAGIELSDLSGAPATPTEFPFSVEVAP